MNVPGAAHATADSSLDIIKRSILAQSETRRSPSALPVNTNIFLFLLATAFLNNKIYWKFNEKSTMPLENVHSNWLRKGVSTNEGPVIQLRSAWGLRKEMGERSLAYFDLGGFSGKAAIVFLQNRANSRGRTCQYCPA